MWRLSPIFPIIPQLLDSRPTVRVQNVEGENRMRAVVRVVATCVLALVIAACGPRPDPELVAAAEQLSAQGTVEQDGAPAETVHAPT